MIPTSSLPHRVTIVVRSAGTTPGGRYGNTELAERRRYERVPARVDDVSSDEDLADRTRTDTFYDVLIRPTHRGDPIEDLDANAVVIWHDRDDLELELDAEPVLVDVGPRARPHHFELRARHSRG